MTNFGRRLRWPLLAVALVLIAVGWLYLRPTSSRDQRAMAPPSHGTVATVAVPRPRGSGAAPDPEARPEPPKFSPSKLPPAMQRVLDGNPDLAQYYALEQKVLPTAEERSNIHAMLSDPEMIQTVKNSLLANETSYSKDAEAKRMVGVEFLSDAINWEDNPSRPAVMQAVEDVMFAQNITSEAPDELAESLAGDKVELYTQMLHRSPDRAALLAEHARGKSVEPLLAYAKDSYDRETAARKADEIH